MSLNMLYKSIHCNPQERHQKHYPLVCLRSCCSQKCVSRSRPAGYGVSNKGIAITNGLDVDGVKLIPVKKCHSISFVWTCDSDVGTIDGPDHTWKVRNSTKLFLGISQVLWE